MHKLLLLSVMASAMPAMAITWTYGNLDANEKTCQLTAWGGMEPASGKLTLPSSYTKDNVVYTVASVAPHALDNLKTVTQITIPATINEIGYSHTVEPDNNYCGGVANFGNCPKLAKFIVADGNTAFYSTADGLLLSKATSDELRLFKVPAAMAVNEGSLTLPFRLTGIEKGAFKDNSTISVLVLPSNLYEINQAGFNDMASLERFKVQSGNSIYEVIEGILYRNVYQSDGEVLGHRVLVSCPVLCKTAVVNVGADVESIEDNAFANTRNLAEITIPANVCRVGRDAFLGSNVRKASIDAASIYGDNTFRQCPELTEITINGNEFDIPDHFAAGAKKLVTVTNLGGVPDWVGKAAFKDCVSLQSYPFSAATRFLNDSIFAGSGLRQVIFDNAADAGNMGWNHASDMFSNCRDLELIDMSAIDMGAEGSTFDIRSNLAMNCLRLKTVLLPRYTIIGKSSSGNPTFGWSTNVEKIVTGVFSCGDKALVFVYAGGAAPRPVTIYGATRGFSRSSDVNEYGVPFAKLLSTSNGARLDVTIYTDAYSPSYWVKRDRSYVYPGAKYYIPGGTWVNYSAAAEAGCAVKEMYGLKIVKKGGNIYFSGIASIPNIKFTSLTLNNGSQQNTPPGSFNLSVPEAEFETFSVTYTVDDIEMKTVYNADMDMSGIESVAADGPGLPAEYFSIDGVRVVRPESGSLYIVRRGGDVTKEFIK